MLRRMILAGTAIAAFSGETAQAQDAAVSMGLSYTADLLALVDGGIDRGTSVLARGDAWVDVDGNAIGLPRVMFHADAMFTHGPDFSGSRAGDAQTVSNIQADTIPQIYEAWAEWRPSTAFVAKAGLIDLNSEFDVQEVGVPFLHSSHGIGPDFSQSGANGPSIFPVLATAIVVGIGRADAVRARFGMFDAIAGGRRDPRQVAIRLPGTSGALLVGEVEIPLGRGELQVGAWHYSERFDRILPDDAKAPSRGAYAMVEGELLPRISAWLRVGLADARTNAVSSYVGGGAVYQPGDWQFGIAVAHARTGTPAQRTLFGHQRALRSETAIELMAARAVTDWLVLQPDVQYVVQPGWNPKLGNALVTGIRLNFGWPAE